MFWCKAERSVIKALNKHVDNLVDENIRLTNYIDKLENKLLNTLSPTVEVKSNITDFDFPPETHPVDVEKPKKKRKYAPRRKKAPEDRKVPYQVQLAGIGDRHVTTPDERSEMYDLWAKGMGIVDIGKAYSRSHGCIYEQLKKEGELRHEQVGRLSRKKARSSKEEK